MLLIEAGGAPTNPLVSIPAGFPQLFRSGCDWAFESEPQRAVGGRVAFTPGGRMLGGSSNMNAMVHQWCHPADLNGWVASGAEDWDWHVVAPVFRSMEKWLGDDGDPGRGRVGPMIVSPNGNVAALRRRFVEAARRAGLRDDQRYNVGNHRGAWTPELAVRDDQRFSVFSAYVEPAMKRPNLAVVAEARATRIAQRAAGGIDGAVGA